MHCVPLALPFTLCETAGRSFRFPPTIGAVGTAPLLFVGINPRVSDSNRHFHLTLMGEIAAFRELAGNRFRDRDYMGPQGLEGHYSVHVWIASQLFPGQPFTSVASVTELFFCASGSSVGLPIKHSPCADKYFGRVLELVRPRIVFAMGRGVEAYLVGRFSRGDRSSFATWGHIDRALIISVPHPNSWGEKRSRCTAAVESARTYLLSGQEPRGQSTELAGATSKPRTKVTPPTDSQGGTRQPQGEERSYMSEGKLVRRIEGPEVSGGKRDWTGNDESARNHNSVVRLSESPLRLRLSWKRGPNDQARLIGVFDLDLPGLLAARHVRLEPSAPNSVRLRFFHGTDEVIYIQVNSQTPGLPIGRMP